MNKQDSNFYKHLELLVQDELERRLAVEKEKKEQEKLLIQQSKMAAMGEMMGVIAHQWKQPLNVISVCASMVEMNLENMDELEQNRSNLNLIHDQVKFMVETMKEFRDFFKPSREQMEFALQDMYENSLKLMGKHLKMNSVEIVEDIDGQKIYIKGFKNELMQVLINLYSNALDVFEERGVKNRKLFIEIKKEDNQGVITIEDSAGGIDSHTPLEKIFEPNFSTKGDKGTGIGLSLSKTIISDHFGGDISVANGEYGAKFTISIPMVKK